jgi:membrane protein DedA with SNARE-associated domain
VDALLNLAHPWFYVLVFLLGFAEGGALVGLFLPGETAMILGGVLVGEGRADLVPMAALAAGGSALGDSVGYWVGRRYGNRLRLTRLGRKVGDERWGRVDDALRKRGRSIVFFGRFLSIFRSLVPPAAGMAHMPYRSFLLLNFPAAVLWAVGFVLLGFIADESWHLVEKWAGRAGVVVLTAIAIVAVTVAVRGRRRRVDEPV